MIRPLLFVPPLVFFGMAVLLAWGMARENAGDLPSVFIGQPAPSVPREALPGFAPLTDADLRTGHVTVVNFWASWCPPCRAEHPVLLRMEAEGLRIAGINFKDNAEDAVAYLAEGGNPFFGLGFDPRGRVAIDWGVTAPPETFIVAGDGRVLFRFIGPLVGSDYEQRFVPALQAALAGP